MVGAPGYSIDASVLILLLDDSPACVRLAARAFEAFEKRIVVGDTSTKKITSVSLYCEIPNLR